MHTLWAFRWPTAAAGYIPMYIVYSCIYVHTYVHRDLPTYVRIRYLKCNKFWYAVATYVCTYTYVRPTTHSHPCAEREWETETMARRVEQRAPFAINMVHSWTFSIPKFQFPRLAGWLAGCLAGWLPGLLCPAPSLLSRWQSLALGQWLAAVLAGRPFSKCNW